MSGQKDPRSKDPPPDYAEPEQDEKARPSAPRESAYPTYKPTWRLSLVELIALIVMGLLLGMSPRSAKGASAIIRSDGGNYGVLRQLSLTSAKGTADGEYRQLCGRDLLLDGR